MRCLLGLQWDDQVKMCVTSSRTCRDHVTGDHVTAAADHAHFDASWLPADAVFHRRQPAAPDDRQRRRHELRHIGHNDVIY